MKNFWISLKYTLAMCVLLTLGYVLVLRLVARVASPNDGEAELVYADGKAVGAANVGQIFTDSIYFWGRPSAVDYDGGGAGGSNKGTTNPEYLAEVEGRIAAFLEAHPYLSREEVPSEMVTASGSGLDPDISVRGAEVHAGWRRPAGWTSRKCCASSASRPKDRGSGCSVRRKSMCSNSMWRSMRHRRRAEIKECGR